ncbi:DUF445 domain-containing protein [Ectobacillus polymachus]|uniref:DUF445 domain-containing protein n=1 Tax=Ectobacillus polymachus TaxID=1508806 RepID=UPI003A883EE7
MRIRTKQIAGVSLGIMGTGFLATLPFQQSVVGAIAQGGFEAGLVGGLADWFAVTALFRHPLGIPIPHTALLPRNRQRVTNGLIHMLENEWLTKESITNKLQKIHIVDKIVEAIDLELEKPSLKKGIAKVLQQAIQHIDEKKVAAYAAKELHSYLRSIDTNLLLHSAIDTVLLHHYEENVLDFLLNKVQHWVEKDDARHKLGSAAMKALMNIELDGFLQFALKSFINIVDEDKLGQIIQDFVRSGITSLQNDNNENRTSVLLSIRDELEKAKENEALLATIDTWKDKLLSSWDGTSQLTDLFSKIKHNMIQALDDSSVVDTFPYLLRLWDNLKNNASYRTQMENWIQEQAALLIEKNHSKIGKLVQENLDKLDNETLVSMMEQNVGKDLQWIRVNGAVCGFLIGIGLTIFKALLP